MHYKIDKNIKCFSKILEIIVSVNYKYAYQKYSTNAGKNLQKKVN